MAAKAQAPLRPLKLPPVMETTLSSGLRLMVARRGPLPLFTARLVVQAGSAVDPVERPGLADMVVRLIRRGTAGMSADELNEKVEQVGGTLSAGVSEDSLSLAISAPVEHLKEMLGVLGQLVCHPTFPPEEVESGKKRALAQLSNDLDEPSVLADRGFLKALWGDHPYGHDVSGTHASIDAMTRDELVTFHRKHFGPLISALVVVGDVEPGEVAVAAEQAFSDYRGGPSVPVSLPKVERALGEGTVMVIDKPEQTQTQVRIGALGIPRGHPDFFPVIAFNVVLGGGFTSRLVREIRVKRGLSYGAGSHFDLLKSGGTFVISTFTKTESTREVLEVALAEVRRMREKGPTAAELEKVKRYVAGIYPGRVETNESVAGTLVERVVFGLPDDWVQCYRERLWAVTRAQAVEAARKHLFADSPAIVLVGNGDAIEAQTKGFGAHRPMPVAEL